MWFRNRKPTPPPEPGQTDEEALQEGPLLSHLVELRDRLLRAVIAVLIVFVMLVPFARDLFTLVAAPLMEVLAASPEEYRMIATHPFSPFFTPFKLSFYLALFITMPVVLYQIWAFVAPGLYRREQRLALPLLVSSIGLFYVGMAFAYFIVFPLIFAFFVGMTPAGVDVATDISQYLDFILTIFLAFGIAFEMPVAVLLLIWSGFTTAEKLASYRPYIFLGCFVIGMLLTPPDIISQTLLAVPVYILYEVGLLMSRYLGPSARSAQAEGDAT